MFTLDQPAITNSTHHHTLLPKHIFYFEQLTEDVTRVFPPLDHARKSWTHPTTLMPWLTSETKIWNLALTLRPPSLNRIRNTQNVILPDPKQDYLLHTTTTHPPTIKALQTKKNTSCFSPHWILTEDSQCQNWKANSHSFLPENILPPLDLNSDLLTIRPLKYI